MICKPAYYFSQGLSKILIKPHISYFFCIIRRRPILAPTIAPVTESTTPIPSIIQTIKDHVQIGIPKEIELTISTLHKNGVYQTLFGYALQITKHAMVKNITKAIDTPKRNSVDLGLFPVSSWSNARNTIDMMIAKKDHPKALSQSKRDFFSFFTIAASLYCSLHCG
jgi:hypothetical protein